MSVTLPGVRGSGCSHELRSWNPKLGAEGLAAHHHLVALHEDGRSAGDALAFLLLAGLFVVLGVDVDELDDEVGIGAGGGDLQARLDGADDGDVFSERRGLVDEDVAAMRGEALILVHVALRNVGAGDVGDERYRMRGIADVGVFAGGAVGALQARPPSGCR